MYLGRNNLAKCQNNRAKYLTLCHTFPTTSLLLQQGLGNDTSLILNPKSKLTVFATTDKATPATPQDPSAIKVRARMSIVPGAAWNATVILEDTQSTTNTLHASGKKVLSRVVTTMEGTNITLSVAGGKVITAQAGKTVANVQQTNELACAAVVHILDKSLA
jgi:uncharacterized surface protein with fasciclin (FAS1) repeats